MNQELEYQSLRDELLREQDREFNLISFSFTATAALIGFALSTDVPQSLIFLTPLIILTFTLLELNNLLYSALTKAVYLRFIESENEDLYWEHVIDGYRNLLRGKATQGGKAAAGYLIFSSRASTWITVGIGYLCIVLTFFYRDSLFAAGVSIFAFVVWTAISLYFNHQIRQAVKGNFEENTEVKLAQIWIRRKELIEKTRKRIKGAES